MFASCASVGSMGAFAQANSGVSRIRTPLKAPTPTSHQLDEFRSCRPPLISRELATHGVEPVEGVVQELAPPPVRDHARDDAGGVQIASGAAPGLRAGVPVRVLGAHGCVVASRPMLREHGVRDAFVPSLGSHMSEERMIPAADCQAREEARSMRTAVRHPRMKDRLMSYSTVAAEEA